MSDEVTSALQHATDGLLHMIESDEPFEVVQWQGKDKRLDEKTLLELSSHPLDTPIETVPLDNFFADLTTDEDWHGEKEKMDVRRYRNLLNVIKRYLSDTKVFRIGSIEAQIFIIGKIKDGEWAGVKTMAVET